MSKNGKVWKRDTNKSGGVVAKKKAKVTESVPTQFSKPQRLACVSLRLTERSQYAGIIKGDRETYVVSNLHSGCQPEKNGWYLCLTPEQNQRQLFVFDDKPVFVVEILSAITGWKSSVNSRTVANHRSPSPNDLFGTEPATLLFGEGGDYFIRIIDLDERKRVAQKLSKREKENTGFKNLWTKKMGFVFSPNKIVGSSLSEEEIIKIVFG